ncbi:hypothetical protein COTS27_00458 [Spirochaetota bacterium]|nr:hypothetical protein COTS27_00458 [Spirochaetota bacterium]
MNRVLAASTPCSIVCLDGFSDAFYELLVTTAREVSASNISGSSDKTEEIAYWKRYIAKQLVFSPRSLDSFTSTSIVGAARNGKAYKITFPVAFSQEVLKDLRKKLLDLGQQAILQAVKPHIKRESNAAEDIKQVYKSGGVKNALNLLNPLNEHWAAIDGREDYLAETSFSTAASHVAMKDPQRQSFIERGSPIESGVHMERGGPNDQQIERNGIGLFVTLPLIDYDDNQLTCMAFSMITSLRPNLHAANGSDTAVLPYQISELGLFSGAPLFAARVKNLEQYCMCSTLSTSSLRTWYQLVTRLHSRMDEDTSSLARFEGEAEKAKYIEKAEKTRTIGKGAACNEKFTLSWAMLKSVQRQLANHYKGCCYNGRLGGVLKAVHVKKPWGKEIWYTGIEKRGVSLLGGLSDQGTVEQFMPISRIMDASYLLKPLVSIAFKNPDKDPILLKVLDPLPDKDYGDLYYELHQKKREVYAISNIHPDAQFHHEMFNRPPMSIPSVKKRDEIAEDKNFDSSDDADNLDNERLAAEKRGAIRLGFNVEKRRQYKTFAAFKTAFREAIASYRKIRLSIDNQLDKKRLEYGFPLNAEVSPAELKKWMASIPIELQDEEKKKRAEMESFSALIPVAVGDTIVIPPGVPHSLQHGVRAVEFQTPHYERLIISFIQKTLTQANWDTDAAFALFDETHIEAVMEKVCTSVSGGSLARFVKEQGDHQNSSCAEPLLCDKNLARSTGSLASPQNTSQAPILSHSHVDLTEHKKRKQGKQNTSVIADFPNFTVFKTIIPPQSGIIEVCEDDYLLLYVLKGDVVLSFGLGAAGSKSHLDLEAYAGKNLHSKQNLALRNNKLPNKVTLDAMNSNKDKTVFELSSEQAFCVFSGAEEIMIENLYFQTEAIYLKAVPKHESTS